ncbi:hypothetical protein [Dongia sp.]|uniref:hypothetical protein n=1 Tax=Dongia sp. TaxID=1977262 RepID=UPI0037529B9C
MAQRYNPPQQSRGGQIFDVVLLLVLVFAALWLPLWLQIAVPSRVVKAPTDGITVNTTTDADGVETVTFSGVTWETLGQNPTMAAQWEKLGHTPETAVEIIARPFEYTIDVMGLVLTAIVILGYYVFVLWASKKEYREVIREKFE